MYGTVIGLNLSLRSNTGLTPEEQKSMTASIILAGIGILSIIIGAIVLFIYGKSKSKLSKLT